MVAMCRALMAQPRVLLMDEPSMGLAPVLVDQVFEIIKQIRCARDHDLRGRAEREHGAVDRRSRVRDPDGRGRSRRHRAEPAEQPPDARGLSGGALMEVIDAGELGRRLSMSAAIDALHEAFRTQDPAATPLRSNLETPAGSLLLMPASGGDGVGVKLVTLTPGNPDLGPAVHQRRLRAVRPLDPGPRGGDRRRGPHRAPHGCGVRSWPPVPSRTRTRRGS